MLLKCFKCFKVFSNFGKLLEFLNDFGKIKLLYFQFIFFIKQFIYANAIVHKFNKTSSACYVSIDKNCFFIPFRIPIIQVEKQKFLVKFPYLSISFKQKTEEELTASGYAPAHNYPDHYRPAGGTLQAFIKVRCLEIQCARNFIALFLKF